MIQLLQKVCTYIKDANVAVGDLIQVDGVVEEYVDQDMQSDLKQT